MKIIVRFYAINGCAKCRKWSGLRGQGALKVMAAMLSFDTAHKTSYSTLIETMRLSSIVLNIAS